MYLFHHENIGYKKNLPYLNEYWAFIMSTELPIVRDGHLRRNTLSGKPGVGFRPTKKYQTIWNATRNSAKSGHESITFI